MTHGFPTDYTDEQEICAVNSVNRPEMQPETPMSRQEYLPIWDAKKAPREIRVTVLEKALPD